MKDGGCVASHLDLGEQERGERKNWKDWRKKMGASDLDLGVWETLG